MRPDGANAPDAQEIGENEIIIWMMTEAAAVYWLGKCEMLRDIKLNTIWLLRSSQAKWWSPIE